MSNEKLVPKLRFREFTDDWTNEKINNIAKIVSGGTPQTNVEEYWNGNINWFTPSEIKNKYFTESKRKITKEGLNNSSAKLLPKNSILVSTRATVGELSIITTESTTNQDFESLIPNKDINNEFLYYSLKVLRKNLLKMSYGSTFLSITKKDLGKININIPTSLEQSKIANFLSSIDNKLELLTKNLYQIQNFKKYLLQNIFSQKLRFDFDDEWETVQLKDIVSVPKKEKIKSVENMKLLTVKLHVKGIEHNTSVVPKLSKKGRPYYQRFYNELLIGRQNFHNGGIGIVPMALNGGICSNAISSFKINEDTVTTNFVFYYLARPDYYKRAEKFIGGTGQKEFSEKELLKLKLEIPSIPEQKKIESILTCVDDKINILNNQLSKTEEFKKGLLQQMFV